MPMDIRGPSGNVSFNWNAWRSLRKVLETYGCHVDLPGSNDGESLTRQEAKEVGRAMLQWYGQLNGDHRKLTGKLAPLDGFQAACLAYALLVCLDGKTAKHE